MRCKNVNEDEYEIYEPMTEGLRVDEQLPVYYNLIFLGRRIVFVIAIFFLVETNQKIWQDKVDVPNSSTYHSSIR